MTTEVNCPECGSDRNVSWSVPPRHPEHRHCWDCDAVFPAWPEDEIDQAWEPISLVVAVCLGLLLLVSC